MISYEEALKIITGQAGAPKVQQVPLMQALGKIAAEDVTSPMQVPSFRNSAMDGFAVCAAQLASASEPSPVTLKIQTAIAAGDVASAGHTETAAQIMTGAIVPEPYDAIVPVELVTASGDTVTFTRPAHMGDHVRLPGEDVTKGQSVLRRGETITPETIMLLSSLGIAEVATTHTPKLHILSTGNEITDDYATQLQGTQIYNSNAPYLLAVAKQQGLEAQYEGIVRDDPALFERKIAAIKEPAILISTGAVSKGVWDFIPESLKNMGATIHFHRVNIRPGKPVLFATLPNGSFYFGLPGNPISAAIGFTFFVMPLVRALQGLPDAPPLMATLENNFTKKGDFRQFLKASVWLDETGCLRANISDGQESFKISPMAANNAWVVLEEEKTVVKAGDRVSVVLYAALKTTSRNEDKTLCQAA
jgi:molybdopterin molybdotransferase